MARGPVAPDPRAMRLGLRLRLLLPVTLLALTLAPPAAHAAVVGISDQDAAAWGDARLRGLGVRHARLVVPWDAATTEPARVQAWLDAVAVARLAPHVAFEHARGTRCP